MFAAYANAVNVQINVATTGCLLSRALAGHANRGDKFQTIAVYEMDGPLDAPDMFPAGSVVNIYGTALPALTRR